MSVHPPETAICRPSADTTGVVTALPYRILGVSSILGDIVDIDTWTRDFKIPHRSGAGHLDGARVREILGIHAKSWQPQRFRDPAVVAEAGAAALARARVAASEIDAILVVTSTPYEIMLDQDVFRVSRALGLRDDVVPIQLNAGCAGLARAFAAAARLRADRVLIVTYQVTSPLAVDAEGRPNPIYLKNETHPQGALLWATPATFSDAAAAVVLARDADAPGYSFYTRDVHAFGDEPGFTGQIVYYPGGGAMRPLGFGDNLSLCAYGLASDEIRRYYTRGMLLNHEHLLSLRPGYVDEVRRYYTHQASPGLVRAFTDAVGLPPSKAPTNAAQLGNLVSPCTMVMLDEDVRAGVVAPGDEICVSVVGAGPERGAFLIRTDITPAQVR